MRTFLVLQDRCDRSLCRQLGSLLGLADPDISYDDITLSEGFAGINLCEEFLVIEGCVEGLLPIEKTPFVAFFEYRALEVENHLHNSVGEHLGRGN